MFVGCLNESHLERCEASRNFYGSVRIFGVLVGESLGSLLGHVFFGFNQSKANFRSSHIEIDIFRKIG